MYDKPFFQKLNMIADWIIRLVILNFLVALLCVPVITIFASLSAGYNTLYDYYRGKDEGIFASFYRNLKEDFRNKLIIGVTLFVTLIIGFYNLNYYNELLKTNATVFYQAGYYLTLFLFIAIIVIFIYLLPVFYVKKNLPIMNGIKMAFYLAGKHIFRTMILIVSVGSPILLLMSKFSAMVFVLSGFSLWLLLVIVITSKVVTYASGVSVKHD